MLNNKIKNILKEPLLHFLIIGAGLFLIYSNMNTDENREESLENIEITKFEMERVRSKFIQATGKSPNENDIKKSVEALIKEKILYLEALKKGLDKNDDVIRVHLAKKMNYVLNDLAKIPEPTDSELEKFLSDNYDEFSQGNFISFNQVLFTSKGSFDEINIEAENFLKRLQNSKKRKISTVGDLVELNQKGLGSLFSKEFIDEIFNLPINSWSGPIKSKYGLHLIYVHSIKKETTPELSQIREAVEQKWRKERQKEANENLYNEIAKSYKVTVHTSESKQ